MKRDINLIDDDIIRKKRTIGELLCGDSDIIEVLDDHDLDSNCPDEYLGVDIFPFIRIPGTQDVSKSYITYMLDDMEPVGENKSMKKQYLKVVVFVHRDVMNTPWGIQRHDLLGHIIKDILHQSNVLGMRCDCISDREGVTDNSYYTRTLQFEMKSFNSQPFGTNKYEKKSILEQDKVVRRESIG